VIAEATSQDLAEEINRVLAVIVVETNQDLAEVTNHALAVIAEVTSQDLAAELNRVLAVIAAATSQDLVEEITHDSEMIAEETNQDLVEETNRVLAVIAEETNQDLVEKAGDHFQEIRTVDHLVLLRLPVEIKVEIQGSLAIEVAVFQRIWVINQSLITIAVVISQDLAEIVINHVLEVIAAATNLVLAQTDRVTNHVSEMIAAETSLVLAQTDRATNPASEVIVEETSQDLAEIVTNHVSAMTAVEINLVLVQTDQVIKPQKTSVKRLILRKSLTNPNPQVPLVYPSLDPEVQSPWLITHRTTGISTKTSKKPTEYRKPKKQTHPKALKEVSANSIKWLPIWRKALNMQKVTRFV
jgi:hypothetical protein